MSMQSFIRRTAFRMDPEKAHETALRALQAGGPLLVPAIMHILGGWNYWPARMPAVTKPPFDINAFRSGAAAKSAAADADADGELRAGLRAAAAAAAAAAGAEVPPALRLAAVLADPPLLQLEVAAGQAHMRALAHVSGGASGPCRLDANVAEERLAVLVADVLASAGAASAAPAEEAALRAPLAEAALAALTTGFSEAAFLRRVGLLFPACLSLVRAEGMPAPVRAALADTLERRVLPVLKQAGARTEARSSTS
jgi:hypothetical protein